MADDNLTTKLFLWKIKITVGVRTKKFKIIHSFREIRFSDSSSLNKIFIV